MAAIGDQQLSTGRRWIYAAKPKSWPKLLVPALLGQAWGIALGGRSVGGGALGAAFVFFDLLFIVFMNDWADRDVDRIKRERFPDGCSPKTIPDGILPAHFLLAAGLIAGLLALAVAAAAAWMTGRSSLFFGGVGCLAVFAAYSLPPLRLNYRGGGELLEMVGVGLALPAWNTLTQVGSLGSEQRIFLWLWGGWAALCLSSAVASGLSDEESDREGGKRTLTTMWGNAVARRLVEGACALGLGGWLVGGLLLGDVRLLGAAGLGMGYFLQVRARSEAATTHAFVAQGRYKASLHAAIWLPGTALAVALGTGIWFA